MIIFQNGKRFTEKQYDKEALLEQEIINSYKLFFGKDTILIDTKKKIGSDFLGNTIPDGFLFDMSDPKSREFYLVEIELASHNFYGHIFPQITKFFAFLRNSKRQKDLTEKLFSIINTDPELKKQFKKYLGEKEIFKFLSDVIDNSQNILLIIDGNKSELPEIMDTYADTWGKMVKIITVKKFCNGNDTIFSVDPEFNDIEYSYQQVTESVIAEQSEVSEEYHLEGVNEQIKDIYRAIKEKMLRIKPTLVFHPAKCYISIRDKKAFAYLKLQKKKIVIIIMLPEDQIRESLNHYDVHSMSESAQNYYNGPCASVNIFDSNHLEEIVDLLKKTMVYNLPNSLC